MESKNYSREVNDCDAFNKIKLLSIENSNIYLTHFNLDIIDSQKEGDQLDYLSFIIHYVRSILEKTENTTVLNILFETEIDTLKIPFKIYQIILFLFYSHAASTKFIENKKFFITFPQLFQQEKFSQKIFQDIKNKISFFDWVFILSNQANLSDSIICKNMDENDKNNLLELIKAEHDINDESKKKLFNLKFEKSFIKQIHPVVSAKELLETLSQMDENISENSRKVADLFPFSFDHLALGGSFDHMHMGHNMLLSTSLILCNKSLSIGVTSDNMIRNKAEKVLLQSYNYREAMVKLACENLGKRHGIKIDTNMINDPAGQAGTSRELQALVLTAETAKGGVYVNEIRKKNGLTEVRLIFANLISEINKQGKTPSIAQTEHGLDHHDIIRDKLSSTAVRHRILTEISIDRLESLYKSWTKLTIHTLKCPAEISHNWFSILRDNYMQSWRRYHNLIHIHQFISTAENYFIAGKLKDNINTLLSIWFHDVVYIPSRIDNEERSAEMFTEFYEDVKRALVIENTLELIDVDKVSLYILCTKHHFEEFSYEDSDLNYMLDFDLMSLAVDESKYFEINDRIRYEYRHHLSEEQWNVGRRKFLEKVLEKKSIYRTEEFKSQMEDNARRNIKLELESFKVTDA